MSDDPGPLSSPAPSPEPAPSQQQQPTANSSFRPRYNSDPPTNPRRGLPTWAWVVIIAVLTIILVPVLLIGALYLYCLFDNNSFHVGP